MSAFTRRLKRLERECGKVGEDMGKAERDAFLESLTYEELQSLASIARQAEGGGDIAAAVAAFWGRVMARTGGLDPRECAA